MFCSLSHRLVRNCCRNVAAMAYSAGNSNGEQKLSATSWQNESMRSVALTGRTLGDGGVVGGLRTWAGDMMVALSMVIQERKGRRRRRNEGVWRRTARLTHVLWPSRGMQMSVGRPDGGRGAKAGLRREDWWEQAGESGMGD